MTMVRASSDQVLDLKAQHERMSLDEIEEFREFYRNELNGFIDVERSILDQNRSVRYARSAIVTEMTLEASAVASLEREERDLLIAGSVACNEINNLIKLATLTGICSFPTDIRLAHAMSMELTLAKLLAGKIHESWKLVCQRYFGTGLSKKWDGKVSSGGQQALRRLKKYFSRKNLISRVRNEAGFHYGQTRQWGREYDKQPQLRWYLGERHVNDLYEYAETAFIAELLGEDQKGMVDAVEKFRNDCVASSQDILQFFDSVFAAFLEEIIQDRGPGVAKMRKYEILANKMDDFVGIPTVFPDEIPSEATRQLNALNEFLSKISSSKP
ncbi:hypothetical protein [Albidovulum aquaemixtae]|nr:hypothetical protein [Defluviimonas aquaemixtae]